MWPMVANKLEILNKAGLSKDNFHEAGAESLVQARSSQKGITDYFQPIQFNEDEDLASLFNDDFDQLDPPTSIAQPQSTSNTTNIVSSPPKKTKF